MADSQPGNGKRKRRGDDDDEGASPSKLAPRTSPHSKAIIVLHGRDGATGPDHHKMYPISVAASPRPVSERRPLKQMRRSFSKLERQPSHLMDIEPDSVPHSSSNTRHQQHTNNDSDLRPCHSCSAVPKRKRDLENYMQCQRCDGRTCIICARQCWKCFTAICKKCIVEVGQDGDPECLECFEARLNS